MSQWLLTPDSQVVPIDDIREHDLSENCWCQPEMHELGILVHNSADRREFYERGELKPS